MFGSKAHKDEVTVRRFIGALNDRDVPEMARMLHEDVEMVDSHGYTIRGRSNALKAIRRFMEIEDSFRLEAASYVEHHGDILITGRCSASDERLARNRLWKMRASDGYMRRWQSFGPTDAPALTRILVPEATFEPDDSTPRRPDSAKPSVRAVNSALN